jgi:cell division protein FtsQ
LRTSGSATRHPSSRFPRPSPTPRGARWALAAGIAAAIVASAYLFSRSAFFAIDHIRVSGASHLTANRVIKETGIERGANVLDVDLEAVESRLERDPWIASASVERSLPDTITVELRERVAVVAVAREDGFDLVAADGTLLATATRALRLPVVEMSTTQPDVPIGGAAAVAAALDPETWMVVATVRVDTLGAITLELRGGTVVRLGTAANLRTKAEALAAMMSYATEHHSHFASIDLRFPDAPSAVLRDGSRFAP